MKRVLVLGAGRVARPLVAHLAGEARLTVASLHLHEVEALLAGGIPARAVALDARDAVALDRLIAQADLAVSLLPASEHARVARICLARGVHLATSSYISPEMAALDQEARAKGLFFLNECGLDPGLDHMSALRILERARRAGGRVRSFRSCCGGLPAPEDNDNPLGYKLSWSPRGVLLAAGNSARFLFGGEMREVPADRVFADPGVLEVEGVGPLEFYPNRDSLRYVPLYGLDGVDDMLRGTLRYPGHCETWFQWARLGLFDPTVRELPMGLTRRAFLALLTGAEGREGLAALLGIDPGHPALVKLAWLGLFDETELEPGPLSPLDLMARCMEARCAYGPAQRDLVVLVHEALVDEPGGRKRYRSTLVEKGNPEGDSAMARTVALPLALAVALFLKGAYQASGVAAPLDAALYGPVLEGLEGLGITFLEEVA